MNRFLERQNDAVKDLFSGTAALLPLICIILAIILGIIGGGFESTTYGS